LLPPDPGTFRRRCFGFGRPSSRLSTIHSEPGPYVILHFVWDYLAVPDRRRLVRAAPAMRPYASLRAAAVRGSVSSLRAPRLHAPVSSDISKARAYQMAMALVRFNFLYGDLIRWLGESILGRIRIGMLCSTWSTMFNKQ